MIFRESIVKEPTLVFESHPELGPPGLSSVGGESPLSPRGLQLLERQPQKDDEELVRWREETIEFRGGTCRQPTPERWIEGGFSRAAIYKLRPELLDFLLAAMIPAT